MEPEQLLAELDRELKQVLSAFASFKPATEEVTVSDDTGRVEVVVSPKAELVKVAVAPNWRDEIEVSALANTVAETIAKAQAKAFGLDIDADGDAVEDADPAEVQRLQDALMAEKTEELLRPVGEDELQRRIAELPGEVERLEALADDVADKVAPTEADLPEDADEFAPDDSFGTRVHSENRMVSVRVMAGFVGEVTIQESWLAARSGIAVTECFDQIIEKLAEVSADPSTGAGS